MHVPAGSHKWQKKAHKNIGYVSCLNGRYTFAFNVLNDDPSDRPAIVPPLRINKCMMLNRWKCN